MAKLFNFMVVPLDYRPVFGERIRFEVKEQGCVLKAGRTVGGWLSLLKLQSRFGDTPLKFQVIRPQLSPKRDCGP